MQNIVSRMFQKLCDPAEPEKRTLSIHQEHEVLLKLEKAGLNSWDAQRIIQSKGNVIAEEMLHVLRNGLYEPTKSHEMAREIMKNNFFGIADVMEQFGIRPTREQLKALADIPYSKATLEACKDTHVLVAVFPMSILQMAENEFFRPLFNVNINKQEKNLWFKKERFSWDEGTVRWYLICKNPPESSFLKNWAEQLGQFGTESDPAQIRIAVYATLGYFLKTGMRLFKEGMARCAELDMSGRRVTIGPFKDDGIRIQAWWDDSKAYFVGATSVRKTESEL